MKTIDEFLRVNYNGLQRYSDVLSFRIASYNSYKYSDCYKDNYYSCYVRNRNDLEIVESEHQIISFEDGSCYDVRLLTSYPSPNDLVESGILVKKLEDNYVMA